MSQQNSSSPRDFVAEIAEVTRTPGYFSVSINALKLESPSKGAYVRPTWLAADKEAGLSAGDVVRALFDQERHLPILTAQASRRRALNMLTTPLSPDDCWAADLRNVLGAVVDWRATAAYCAEGIEPNAAARPALTEKLVTFIRSALNLAKIPFDDADVTTYVFQFPHRLAEGMIREATWLNGPEAGKQFKDSQTGRAIRDARGPNIGPYAVVSPITAISGNWFSQGANGGKVESAWGCPVECGPDGDLRSTYAAKGSSGVVDFPDDVTYNYEESLTSPSAIRFKDPDETKATDKGADENETDEDDWSEETGKKKQKKKKKRNDDEKASAAGRSAIPPQRGMPVVNSDAITARPTISLGTIAGQLVYGANHQVDWNATRAWRKFALAYSIYALSRTVTIGFTNIRSNCDLIVADRTAAMLRFRANVGTTSVDNFQINLIQDVAEIKRTVEICAQDLVAALGNPPLLAGRLRVAPWEIYLMLKTLEKADGGPSSDLLKRLKAFGDSEIRRGIPVDAADPATTPKRGRGKKAGKNSATPAGQNGVTV